jgi:hypothetical protein
MSPACAQGPSCEVGSELSSAVLGWVAEWLKAPVSKVGPAFCTALRDSVRMSPLPLPPPACCAAVSRRLRCQPP